jgi:hypothetical protein
MARTGVGGKNTRTRTSGKRPGRKQVAVLAASSRKSPARPGARREPGPPAPVRPVRGEL